MFNARDLGGYPTLDGGTTRWRSVLRADDPAQLTPEGLDAIAAAGIATVVDLRWPEEAAGSPSPIPGKLRNVRHHSISLLSGSAMKWAKVCGEPPKETWITAVLTYSRAELVAVLRAIAAAPAEPVMFHCVAGKDRTGAVAAVLLALADVQPEAIAFDYAASSENLRDYYLRRYSNLTREEILEAVRCPPEGVYRMLEYLRGHGGIEAFLGDLGMSETEIVRVRSRLRD
ncbi:MAG TPA: tyrosine-protein phosphatase [Steroidobacteraceae bacterium]|jgi:protein-tyrosine phosphatase